MLANIMAGAQNLLTLDAVLALVAGTVGGMVIGALPGFSAAMGVSLLIPITYGMNPVAALTMLVASTPLPFTAVPSPRFYVIPPVPPPLPLLPLMVIS